MITLFYAPGACSMAAHIVLEEAGEKYEAKRMDLGKGEQRTEAYMKIHPLGRVPALLLDDGSPLTENTAILPYLGKRFGLWPKDAKGEAQALSFIGYLRVHGASRARPHLAARALHGRQERLSRHPGAGQEVVLRLPEADRRQAGGAAVGLGPVLGGSILTPSPSTPGACAASCRWPSSRTTARTRTACCSAPPSSAWWRTRRSRFRRRPARRIVIPPAKR